jgi:hypothetical protein
MEKDPAGDPVLPPKDGSEPARLSEKFSSELLNAGFDIHELNEAPVRDLIAGFEEMGVNVSFDEGISESDREAILGEVVPATEVALKRGTRGHKDTWDLALTYEAIEKAKMIDDRIQRLDPETRGTMGNVAMVLAMLRRDRQEAQDFEGVDEERVPIFEYSTRDDGLVRIRTFTGTSDGKRVSVEVWPDGIKIVPQYNPDYDPELGRADFGDSGGRISARTYIFIVPKEVANQIQPRHEEHAPKVEPLLN